MIKITVMLIGFLIVAGTAGASDNDHLMSTFQMSIQMIAGISLFGGALLAILMEEKD